MVLPKTVAQKAQLLPPILFRINCLPGIKALTQKAMVVRVYSYITNGEKYGCSITKIKDNTSPDKMQTGETST